MSEPTLPDLLDNLAQALTEYQQVVNRMFEIHSARIQLADTMITELRDDTHESLTALSNRIENATRTDDADDDAYMETRRRLAREAGQ